MAKYLAYDGINGDYEEFDTIEEAREYLEECFLVYGEYHAELDSCKIYKLCERVDYDVLEVNSDPQIWKHKFVTMP
jgi:hypothetical protein